MPAISDISNQIFHQLLLPKQRFIHPWRTKRLGSPFFHMTKCNKMLQNVTLFHFFLPTNPVIIPFLEKRG